MTLTKAGGQCTLFNLVTTFIILFSEWALHMLSFPHHLAVSCFVRASEELGLFKPHHPLYQSLVSALEFISVL